ncbi:hypothetical protein [Bacillus bombysepticus]|uniref:hypothetical protein n=1 Tax=Bacillus bombysepticus TaxID=658666 RepID=UPI0030176878
MGNDGPYKSDDNVPFEVVANIPPLIPQSFDDPLTCCEKKRGMCNCLRRWTFVRLYETGPYGNDFFFFPIKVCKNGVKGYIFVDGQRITICILYKDIYNFMCFA